MVQIINKILIRSRYNDKIKIIGISISSWLINLPHSVKSSLATVPASQAVQEDAPAVLTELSSQLTQEDMSASMYVPALHSSAEWYKS